MFSCTILIKRLPLLPARWPDGLFLVVWLFLSTTINIVTSTSTFLPFITNTIHGIASVESSTLYHASSAISSTSLSTLSNVLESSTMITTIASGNLESLLNQIHRIIKLQSDESSRHKLTQRQHSNSIYIIHWSYSWDYGNRSKMILWKCQGPD